MKHLAVFAFLALALPAAAQEAAPPVTPGSVIAAASAEEWIAIAPEDLLVMDLAPDARGNPRRVVIQLMPPPFSQPWVENIRTLAAAHWWDGTSVNRVQDNYVTQWGDVTEAKPLPDGVVSPTTRYVVAFPSMPGPTTAFFPVTGYMRTMWIQQYAVSQVIAGTSEEPNAEIIADAISRQMGDSYALETAILDGWPIGLGRDAEQTEAMWPVHCYGAVGVGRNVAPDTGTGAELYTIIGQPQRHMDRNLAVVGRVIEGMEHLSSLPRGSGELGFYTEEEADLRVPIVSVRLASELADAPRFEYLDTASESFARLVAVRANRNDDFYTVPAGGVDVCSVGVPIRRAQ